MFKYINKLSFITDIIIKMSLGIVFFNYGYVKLLKLLNNDGQAITSMIEEMPFFNFAPIFFSWSLAISETFIIFALIYGIINFLPFSNLVSRFTGILSLFLSTIILYQHIFIWGDNIFSYGPIEFLNIEESGRPVLGQFLLIPLSLYILFHNRQNFYLINDNK